jgi:hypothetical protein
MSVPRQPLASLKPQRPKDPRRLHGHARVEEHRVEARQGERRADGVTDPPHHPRARIEADGNIGSRLARCGGEGQIG